jgi:hypothetical protein
MTPFLPFTSLSGDSRELGLVVAVLLGFGFGFVLERAGFGRADKLAAQFYLRDMTVFKVMFSAIVTAMLGVMVAAGLGVVELRSLSESVVSTTYIWSMLIGGVLLGVGFIISGYCPGTSAVSAASGNLDGVFTFGGVILGSLLYAEAYPLLGKLSGLGDLGQIFLYDVFGVPAPLLAIGITLMALGLFLGAEKVERIMARRSGDDSALAAQAPRPRRFAFGALGAVSLLALGTLALPATPRAATGGKAQVGLITQQQLAHRVLEEPWTLRVLDVRDEKACQKKRIPGAECAPLETLPRLGLPYASGQQDLVLVTSSRKSLEAVPRPARGYPGKVLLLSGGFDGWRAYALTKPQVPAASAGPHELEAYKFRSALHSAMTGRKPPAPAPAGKIKYVPKRKKKKGGGCG